jgi:RNA polymerase sigma-70 factor (ECF subfamily)
MPELSIDAAQGDSLEDLSRRFRPVLMAFFLRRMGTHAEAEDLTQEVFARLVGMDLTAVDSAQAYLFSIAGNLLRDRGRRDQVRADYALRAQAEEGVGIDLLDPARVAASRQSLQSLSRALSALPELTRSVFVLHRLENFGRAEIARAFGLSASTVDRHLLRALTALAQCVEDAP